MTTISTAPTIHTERLTLRAHRREDLVASIQMWGDPEVVKYIGGIPSTQERCWTRILSYIGHWQLMGFGYWAMEEKLTGHFIGRLT